MKNTRYIFLLLYLIPFISFSQIQYFKLSPLVADSDYIAKTIIFNVKEEYRGNCNEKGVEIENLSKAFNAIGVIEIKKKFPGKTPPTTKLNRFGEKMEDLSLLYEVKYNSDLSIEKAINTLLATAVLEYAEPHYLPHLFYVPNDPRADTLNASFLQYNLKNIRAYQAWDIQKGDTTIIIGITDTGVDIFHPDLYDNLSKNYLDTINGIDDDGDGFTDNFYGWDLAENDSSPQWEAAAHGVFVSGVAAGVVDNNEGMAGVGFKSKFLAVKISDAQGALTMAYEGIVYAGDHGCSVINCSWGGLGGAGQYGQTIVNYATNNCNALVVAACGNSDNAYTYYPASYDNVISVAGTNSSDCKWHDTINHRGSNYGLFVDICAPGEGIFSTFGNGGYAGNQWGTSFAAPAVCGAAAILKASNPTFSALQLGEQLKLTADVIDTMPCNQQWAGLLGTGRLNLYKALTVSNIPSLVMTSYDVTDNNDDTWVENDTLSIVGTFKNYLAQSTSSLKATLTSTSPYAMILNSSTLLGSMTTFQSKDNAADPFLVRILPGTPISTQLDFKITFEDTPVGYQSSQYFSVIVNIDYMDIDTNRVATTVTSKGRIGYNLADDKSQGIGFTYDNSSSFLTNGGFILGTSTSTISDNIYGDPAGTFDNDFKSVDMVHRVKPTVKADFETENIFNDSLAPFSTRLNVTVTHKSFAWAEPPDDKFIIMEFTIKNHGSQTLNNLYAGLFMDFSMSGEFVDMDKVDYDPVNRMGYTYSLLGGPYAGIQLLSSGAVHHYAFDKDGQSNGTSTSINIINGFTSYEKYSALKVNQFRNTTAQNGNDVADLISSGPFVLTPGDSTVVAFALLAGDHYADLQSSAEQAYDYYNSYGIGEYQAYNLIETLTVYPNPASNNVSLSFELKDNANTSVSLYDMNGKKAMDVEFGMLNKGVYQKTLNVNSLSSGNYSVVLHAGSSNSVREICISR